MAIPESHPSLGKTTAHPDYYNDAEHQKANLVNGELAELKAMRGSTEKGSEREKKINEVLSFQYAVIRSHPWIAFLSIFIFVALSLIGLTIVYFARERRLEEWKEESLGLAQETGNFFSKELDQAMFPLLSLAQFMKEMVIFHPLTTQIGPVDALGSAPLTDPVHRNVTGICDDDDMVSKYNEIAKTIKTNARMPGVLVNLQVAPNSVLCYNYPLINTEDFEEGQVLDNRGAVGLDLVKLAHVVPFLERTYQDQEEEIQVTVQGPFTLTQCSDCPPAVRQAFAARTPVRVPGLTSRVGDAEYPDTWGAAAILLNWEQLVLRSGMYEMFDQRGLGFQLTKTDIISVDPESLEETKEVTVLAETSDFEFHETNGMLAVTVALDATDNEWEMTVVYPIRDRWFLGAVGIVLAVALCVTLLIQSLLVQRKRFKSMQKKYIDDVACPQKLRLKMFLEETGAGQPTADDEDQEDAMLNVKPIADMFPHVTVMLADIVGFTAWASEREPPLILCLLQNIFYAFDRIAQKRGVFKVETIGDCYIACAGIPEPQVDHAVRMAKFAQECLLKVREVTKRLEQQLGPDTGELRMRFGLHSGPVTAGVLPGSSNARIQLFGDTMNTAAKMEATGKKNMIHVSEATANLLKEAGKHRWIEPRSEQVVTKGKGTIQTYWVSTRSGVPSKKENGGDEGSTSGSHEISSGASELWGDGDTAHDEHLDVVINEKSSRLVEWHVESLTALLRMIVAQRQAKKPSRKLEKPADPSSTTTSRSGTVLDEVKEVISIPKFESHTSRKVTDVTIDSDVIHQLREYVSEIASLYRSNPFHNFEHASHVSMAVHKLLSRVVNPENVNYQSKNVSKLRSDLHDSTFGITSDPLTHFGVVLSALIHDVDHTGVSNAQLGKEKPELAERYRNQSLAEQNSVDLAWDLLMEPKFHGLQSCIFSNQSELERFRQIVVNTVLATDIFDKELKELRNARWQRAFYPDQFSVAGTSLSLSTTTSDEGGAEFSSSKQTDTNRKATIVIEHIIQASDIAHTMQHWHVYAKWNERLFQEMYVAWKRGRSPKNPAEGWYKGELWFFDNYIIPLAKKLEECGAFGVSSDECLHHALSNRSEWESRGLSVVEEMVERCQKLHLGEGSTSPIERQ